MWLCCLSEVTKKSEGAEVIVRVCFYFVSDSRFFHHKLVDRLLSTLRYDPGALEKKKREKRTKKGKITRTYLTSAKIR